MREKAAALPVPGDLLLWANVNSAAHMFSTEKNEVSELYLILVHAHEAKSELSQGQRGK